MGTTEVIRVGPSGALRLILDRALAFLRRGELIAFPTETVYGIGGSAGCPGTAPALARLKGRDPNKPFQALISSEDQVRALGYSFPTWARALTTRWWPGPLTLVLSNEKGETQGFRAPRHPAVLALIELLGQPILASSANRAGGADALSARDLIRTFSTEIPLVVDGGPARLGRPSTVVDASSTEPRILREGAISVAEILGAIGL
ncbi:MAG: threonylcarbamoyl-AMP synthase [Candidatus Omnitrophica bacterium]|nr:threonylcarbamoyl-AMP synthase [Candidatus Omnitrophota bacterium]